MGGSRWEAVARWTALLVYVLLRFLSRMSSWSHSFTRIFAVVRASLWQRVELHGFLKLLTPFYMGHISVTCCLYKHCTDLKPSIFIMKYLSQASHRIKEKWAGNLS